MAGYRTHARAIMAQVWVSLHVYGLPCMLHSADEGALRQARAHDHGREAGGGSGARWRVRKRKHYDGKSAHQGISFPSEANTGNNYPRFSFSVR